MTRELKQKELMNARLANNYGGWVYCESCNKTIGYLCYITYDHVRFDYRCKCGGGGSMSLAFPEENPASPGSEPLITLKNRLCCPKDKSPLVTILAKKLEAYKCEITCTVCHTKYMEEKT